MPNPFQAEIVWRDLNTITPYVNNTKQHPTEQIDKIAGSIAEFGWDQPIVVDGDGVIIKGHGRRQAALRLGLKLVPVVVRTDLSEAQVRAARIADNRVAESGWDMDMLQLEVQELAAAEFELGLLGFEEQELDALLNPEVPPAEGNTDPDAVPEQAETRCKPGDLWILGNHRLLCGDATNVQHVERLMGGELADLWLTDPPYGVSYQAKVEAQGRTAASKITNDDLPLEQMAVFWQDLATSALLATTDRAAYYWFACQGGDQMMMMMSISRAGWKVRHELIWVKDALVLGRCDYHYKHEPILYGWKQEGTHEFHGDRTQTSVLEFARPKKNDVHPTMKPVELIERLILNSTKPGQKVLETCGGSGTTLIASERTGRRCFAVEIDPHYCDVILSRWEAHVGKEAQLAEG